MENSKQQQIIKSNSPNIVVSASAGCGKTTAMIGRVVNLIEKGAELKNMLILTYTNAAADDIKQKLYRTLRQNANLTQNVIKQINYINYADIGTLHSFCNNLLKNYFYVVKVEPKFDVLEENNAKCLMQKAVNKVMADYCQKEDKVFLNLTEIFSANRSIALQKTILDLYFLRTLYVLAEDFYKSALSSTESIENNKAVKFANLYLCELFQSSVEKLEGFYVKDKSCRHKQFILGIIDSLKQISKNNDFKNNAKIIENLEFSKIPLLTKEQKSNFEVAGLHDELKGFKKALSEKVKNLKAIYSADAIFENLEQSKILINKLLEILAEFEKEYDKLKFEKCSLDFFDLEKYAIEILDNKDVLAEIQNKYEYIFIDECQDINDVQNCLIQKLNIKNKFFVGDIKQCIYRFRGAKPEIFKDKCIEFKTSEFFRLSENYRTNGEILDFVNSVFSKIMYRDFSLVEYADTEILKGASCAKLSDKNKSVIIDVIDSAQTYEDNDEEEEGKEAFLFDKVYSVKEDKVSEKIAHQEGLQICKRILELTCKTKILNDDKYLKENNRDAKITFSDICILVRGKKNYTQKIFNTIKSSGIPISAEFKYSVREYEEIEELIQFLFLLDNFRQDIPLMSVLKTFYNFSDYDFSVIKNFQKSFNQCFFECENVKEEKLKQKIQSVISDLKYLRDYSKFNSVSLLLQKIVKRTDYVAKLYASDDGTNKVERIGAFIADLNGKYYDSDIFTFNQYMLNFGEEIKISGGILNGDSVKINTVHQSKGLEYPVVILAGSQNKFNFLDSRMAMPYNQELGLGLKTYNFENKTVTPSVVNHALSVASKYEQVKEEINILYVALTRARYRLYLTCAYDTSKIKLARTLFDIKNSASQLNLIDALSFDNSSEYNFFKHKDILKSECEIEKEKEEEVVNLQKIIFSKYRYEENLNAPLKTTATEANKLKADFETEGYEYTKNLFDWNFDFISTGTMYHKIFENLDFTKNADAEIERLKKLKLIDSKTNLQIIKNFLNLDLFKNLKDAQVFREQPFILNVPYNKIWGTGDEFVLLQGKIDLMIVRKNKVTIVDYKLSGLSEEKLKEEYRKQLLIYAMAAKQILNLETEQYIYSVFKNELIKIE
ncbi:MAG: UvrD-helicase domain-containing protein [Firmicutes bacterium]|nr:UvrD-helicase domain-containing protein [Bacillota bacterium]